MGGNPQSVGRGEGGVINEYTELTQPPPQISDALPAHVLTQFALMPCARAAVRLLLA